MIGVVVVMVGVLVVVLGMIGVPVVPVVVNCVVGVPVVPDDGLGQASGNWTSPFTLKSKQKSSVLVLLPLLSIGCLVQFSRSFIT